MPNRFYGIDGQRSFQQGADEQRTGTQLIERRIVKTARKNSGKLAARAENTRGVTNCDWQRARAIPASLVTRSASPPGRI